MHANIISHNSATGISSGNTLDYLEKENRNEKILNNHLILEGKEDEINPNSEEHFFSQDFNPYDLSDKNSLISQLEATYEIDNNRGTQNLKSSNFYMLNLNPSLSEQLHMENIAMEELKSRGLFFEKVKENPSSLEYFNEQKDQIMKLQLKLFTKDIMNEYASHMDREIYSNQEQLPNNLERKKLKPIIDSKYKSFLSEKGFDTLTNVEERIELTYKKSLDYNLNNGKVFIFEKENRELSIFVPTNKFEQLDDNSISIDKEFFNDKQQEAEDKLTGIFNSDEKVILDISIKKTMATKTFIGINDSKQGEITLWINNKDFEKINSNQIEMRKYQSDKLIEKAIERDKGSKTLIEISYLKHENIPAILNKDGTEKNPEMQIFISKVNGLNEPIELKFPKVELIEKDGKFFIEQFKYDYKMTNAVTKGIEKEFGNIKDTIKNEVWKEAGFDVSKRKVEGKDLLYFGKVETERIYKHNDKSVIRNKEIFKELKQLKNNIINRDQIAKLEKQLLKDPHTQQIIKEGVKKGGLNYHTHIIVSRHDKTSLNPLDKVSMSPNASYKQGTLNNGAKIGFDRTKFFEKIYASFDEKFEYVRPVKEQFKYINNESKYIKGRITGQVRNLVKQQIMKETGMQTVKSELMPIHQIKSQIMPLPIPTSLPKNKVDLAVKAIKLVMGLVKDRGLGY